MRDYSWLNKLSDSDISLLKDYACNLFPGQIDSNIQFLDLKCPECNDYWGVEARQEPFEHTDVRVPVLVREKENYAYLGWEHTEADCTFCYCCSNCGHTFGYSLEDIQDMYEKEKRECNCSYWIKMKLMLRNIWQMFM